jgi:hypothetical protein
MFPEGFADDDGVEGGICLLDHESIPGDVELYVEGIGDLRGEGDEGGFGVVARQVLLEDAPDGVHGGPCHGSHALPPRRLRHRHQQQKGEYLSVD